ncbi:MAG: flagellar hook-length control protein FliK [Glaciecola sp.]
MMQQIATAKSGSAASSLPFDNAVQTESKQAFNDIFAGESARTTAFEKARQQADSAAVKQHQQEPIQHPRRDSSSSEEGVADKNTTSANKAQHNDPEQNAQAQSRNDKATVKTSNVDNAEQSQPNQGQPAESNNESTSKTVVKSSVDEETKSRVSENSAEIKNEFDYISYVNQLAKFTGNETFADDAVLVPEINVTTDNSEILALQVPLSESATGELQSDADEFVTINLSKQDLQMILDAQNSQLDLNAEALSEQDLQKLQDIIASMLNQLQQEGDTNKETVSIDQEAADKALLSILLLNQQPSKNSDAKPDIDTPAVAKIERSAINAGVLEALNSKNTDAAEKAKLSDLTNVTAPDTNDEWAKTPDTNAKLPKQDVWSKTPDAQAKHTSDTAKSPINMLAQLNDEQTTEALKNLSERVQSIVAELKTPTKGNEFVAALQSGVKEFKQQLAAGREPGMDLKALINDAIASTNTELDKGVQPKLDSAANQFNAVLNLASAVNYSATQQQAQVLGMTDNQFAKEINALQSEGTKLANAANSQLNGQSSVDKAINIFKAEGQQQLTEKVRWMVNARNPSAEIRLDPPDLGGMQIKINLSGDTAQVNFSVQSAAAKEALDQAVPRLREMLSQQGIELGQSSVQQESQGQQNNAQDESMANETGGAFGQLDTAENAEEAIETVVQQRVSNGAIGGIDYYA